MEKAGGLIVKSIFALLLLCGFSPAIFDGCDYKKLLVEELASVDLEAAVLSVGCGATTSEVEWVLLYRQGENTPFERSRVVALEGKVKELDWDGKKLIIYYDADKLFGAKSRFMGVDIVYENVGA